MLSCSVSATHSDFMGDVNIGGNVYASGNLSVFDLTIRSGNSLTLAGAKFSNEGTFTSVDTDFAIHEDEEPTAFLGIYAHNESTWATANIIMEAGIEGLQSILNIIKNSPTHPFAPNASGIINQGDLGLFVDHSSHLAFSHYTNITRDDYGNIIYMDGIQRLMMLNDTSLNLEKVDLLVNGTALADYFIGDGSGLTGVVNYEFGANNFNGSGNFTTSGNVGIGIDPVSKFQVEVPYNTDNDFRKGFSLTWSGGARYMTQGILDGNLRYGFYGRALAGNDEHRVWTVDTWEGGGGALDLDFHRWYSSGNLSMILRDGMVKIGKNLPDMTGPTHTLEVVGDADISGNVNIDKNLTLSDSLIFGQNQWTMYTDPDYASALRIVDSNGYNYLNFRNDTFKPSIQFHASVISRGSGNASASNFGFGWLTLDSATAGASDNLAIGSQALYNLIDGDDNFAVGQNAGESATDSSGSLYLGNYAGYTNNEDNKLFIGNTDTTGRTLIEGDMGTGRLEINGDLFVNGSRLRKVTTIIALSDTRDVKGEDILLWNTAAAPGLIRGFSNGTIGQCLTIIKSSDNNPMTIYHKHASGDQKIVTPDATDLVYADYGGAELCYMGTYWHVVDK